MEYGFELALCAHLEGKTDWVLSRQLGGAVANPGTRVVDVVGVEPGPRFGDRAQITTETIPPAAIEANVGHGEAVRPEAALDCHPERAREIADRAVELGFFTSRYRGGRRLVRQTTRYPDRWFNRLIAIENKPDLGQPGDLARQLRFDTSLALFDRVVLATASHVTGAHLNRLPDSVGIWRFDPDTSHKTVVREPEPLAVGEAGIELRDRTPARRGIAHVPPEAKTRKRRRIAERAYGKGWRPELPACSRCNPTADGRPLCTYFDRVVDPATDCGEGCGGYDESNPPDVDTDALRAARTPWVQDPAGTVRRQTGLDRFE